MFTDTGRGGGKEERFHEEEWRIRGRGRTSTRRRSVSTASARLKPALRTGKFLSAGSIIRPAISPRPVFYVSTVCRKSMVLQIIVFRGQKDHSDGFTKQTVLLPIHEPPFPGQTPSLEQNSSPSGLPALFSPCAVGCNRSCNVCVQMPKVLLVACPSNPRQ